MNRRNRNQKDIPDSLLRTQPAEVILPESGIHILESHHSPGFQMSMGSWPYHKLCWVPMGRGMLSLKGETIPLKRDDLMLIPNGVEHRFIDHPDEPLTLVIVCFSKEVSGPDSALGRIFDHVRQTYAPCRPLRAKNAFRMEELRNSYRLLLQEQTRKNTGYEAALHGGLIALMVSVLRGCVSGHESVEASREKALDGILDYLENNFDQSIQLEDMAARCGLSPRRFSDVFKQRTGESLIRYLNRRRIHHAMERLRETGHIAYACHESGFHDMAYFYRTFKKHTGMTPGAYVKSAD